MQSSKILAVLLTASMLTACAQPGGPGITQGGGLNKQDIGTGIGAIGGGVIGSTMGRGAGRTAATIGGALIGGLIGNQVGQSLDNADRAAMERTTQHALENSNPGQPLPWTNPQNGNSITVVPAAPYQNANGQYCREYTQTVVVGGKKQEGYGKACRQPDGTWQIVSQ